MSFNLHSEVILSKSRPLLKDRKAWKREYNKRYSRFDLTSDCPALHIHKKFRVWFHIGNTTQVAGNPFLASA